MIGGAVYDTPSDLLAAKKENGKEGRVRAVEFWRLCATVMIVIWHTASLPGCTPEKQLLRSTGVEFFLFLSGFLMAQSCAKGTGASEEIGEETWRFICRKAKRIWPIYLFAMAFDVVIRTVMVGLGTVKLAELPFYIWDLLFLRAAGLQGHSTDTAVGAAWYLSAMILAMWILYPIMRRWKDVFLHVIAPLTAIFIYGRFSVLYGTVHKTLTFEHGICLGLLRGIAGICVGCVCWQLCQTLKTNLQSPTPVIRTVFTVLECGTFAGDLVIAMNCWDSQWDFLRILLLAIGLTISFGGWSYTNTWLRHFPVKWIGNFSLALYLNHVVWIRMFDRWQMPLPFGDYIILYLILSLFTTVLCVLTVDCVSSAIGRKQMKKKFNTILNKDKFEEGRSV